MRNHHEGRGHVRRAIAVSLISLAALGVTQLVNAQADPVVFSFATVGDSRTDPGKPDATTLLANSNPTMQGGAPSLTGAILPQDNQWVQNTQAFATILAGIQSQDPNLLFFNGDMIFGYGRPMLPTAWANGKPNSWTTAQTVVPDTIFEIAQYAYWRGMVAPLFLSGTYVIPVPGNHETQCSYSAEPYSTTNPNPNCNTAAQGNLTGKTAYAENENLFRFSMGDLIGDLQANTNIRFSDVTGFYAMNATGLTATTAPQSSTYNGSITGSQAELSYSFDIQAQPGLLLHFVVINTDPSGADSTAPADWLATDLAAAQSRGAAKYFVFGHKAAFTYNYAAATGGGVLPSNSSPGPGGLDANFVVMSGTCPGITCVYTEPYRDRFWSVIAQYGATYFSGHEHTVNVAQYADPTGKYPGMPYQVIVGSGGSPFDDKLVTAAPCSAAHPCEPTLTNPYDRYYAWALVSVHASGNVSLQVSGFGDNYQGATENYGPIQDLSLYDVASLQ